MACPRCERGYRRVVGNQLICDCGYIEEVKSVMVDDDKFIVECELKFWQIIDKMHRAKVHYSIIYEILTESLKILNEMQMAGVRYTVVHGILTEIVKTLEIMSYSEDWLEQYNK